MTDSKSWPGGSGPCRVPLWIDGVPAGFCGKRAFGPQYPEGYFDRKIPYCSGPCCPEHGGPGEGGVIIFQDGYTARGRPVWCAVMPDFVDLHSSYAGFSEDPSTAVEILLDRVLEDLRKLEKGSDG